MMLIPGLAFGQGSISGIVNDCLTGNPLSFATVYVNGTTRGTVTDAEGKFSLTGIHFPADVVFSYIGYVPEVRNIVESQEGMQIGLRTNNQLPEVVISNTGLWEKNLKYFKRMFLGDDKWGKHAEIRNGEALVFDVRDSEFKASASEPLIIDLPLLGYGLYVDLVDFTVTDGLSATYLDIFTTSRTKKRVAACLPDDYIIGED